MRKVLLLTTILFFSSAFLRAEEVDIEKNAKYSLVAYGYVGLTTSPLWEVTDSESSSHSELTAEIGVEFLHRLFGIYYVYAHETNIFEPNQSVNLQGFSLRLTAFYYSYVRNWQNRKIQTFAYQGIVPWEKYHLIFAIKLGAQKISAENWDGTVNSKTKFFVGAGFGISILSIW